MTERIRFALLSFCLSAAATPAFSKVVLTGYGDLRFAPWGSFDIGGDVPALNRLGLADAETLRSRGFSADAVGFFATTSLSEDLSFQTDLTFRQIGQSVGQTSLQYAYLDWTPVPDTELRGGKITLPFGYYNEHYFYGFQRPSVTGPVFQSGILGLPIADWGAAARKRWIAGPLGVQLDVYSVNGYDTASSNTFRSATVPSATLNLANHLGPTDTNGNVAWGGRLAVSPASEPEDQAGVSYYAGAWDAQAQHRFEMIDSHAHLVLMKLDVLAEVLHLSVHGDQGFAENVGNPDWQTDGYFLTASHPVLRLENKPLIGWGRYEWYRSKGEEGGTGDETLESWAGGLAYHLRDNLMVKAEYLWLDYVLPFSGVGRVFVKGDEVTTALTVTF